MQPIGNAFARLQERWPQLREVQDITDPEYVEKSLLELRPTEQEERRLSALRREQATHGVDSLGWRRLADPIRRQEARVERCRQRDALQATRPADCFCLGLGGRGRSGLPRIEAHPDSGKPVNEGILLWKEYCPCADGHALRAQHAAIVEAERKTEAEDRLRQLFGHPDVRVFEGLTLDTYPQHHPSQRQLVATLRAWLEDATAPWLYLFGPVGVGKSGLALDLVRRLIERGELAVYRSAPRLLDRIRETYDERSNEGTGDVLAGLYRVDVLLLDDLGKEQGTRWERAQMFRLVDERYAAKRRTLVTSNLDLFELAGHLDDPAVPDRIRHHAGDYIVRADVPNLRGQRRAA